jgi:hypothetical protein
VAEAIRREGGEALFVRADVFKSSEVEFMVVDGGVTAI